MSVYVPEYTKMIRVISNLKIRQMRSGASTDLMRGDISS